MLMVAPRQIQRFPKEWESGRNAWTGVEKPKRRSGNLATYRKEGQKQKKGEGQIHGNGKGWVLAGQIMRDSWQPPAGLCMQVLHSALKQCLAAIQLYVSPHVASSKRVLLCLCLACLLSFV
jgi:hypothetical protein